MINLVCAFDFVPGFAGNYYYVDRKTGQKIVNTYYFPVFTDFGMSHAGFVSTIVVYVIRDLLTLIVGVFLNVLSAIHLRNYYKKKQNNKKTQSKIKLDETNSTNNSMGQTNTTIASTNTVATAATAAAADEKKKNSELKLLSMVVMLCSISIVQRSFLLACNIYGSTGVINDASLIMGTMVDLVLAIGPAVSFFVFYFFNIHFHNVVLKIFCQKK